MFRCVQDVACTHIGVFRVFWANSSILGSWCSCLLFFLLWCNSNADLVIIYYYMSSFLSGTVLYNYLRFLYSGFTMTLLFSTSYTDFPPRIFATIFLTPLFLSFQLVNTYLYNYITTMIAMVGHTVSRLFFPKEYTQFVIYYFSS